MKLPISKRLLACSELISDCGRVADVGCDHGYLGIYLLREKLASFVYAMDLRPKPLQKAKENARLFETDGDMQFYLCNGLAALQAGQVDTIVCAGMGGDTIVAILNACPWIRDSRYTLILQSQSSGNDLRRWLGEQGFSIEREVLVKEGGYLYSALVARFGGGQPMSPGRQYVSEQLLSCGSDLLGEYLQRVESGVAKAVQGLERATQEADRARLAYYEQALTEIQEMRKCHDNG